ncbi:DDE superfamily endonuclease [Saccharopolyspora spinosa]|uniref:DDE superfamily endonuclease n=2 Tax=Saccharopolyspora spinosa TaxID=60894 RepID=A0A2N3Y195_SACSN|nr:DDE superfamily endonuclease [Saccharopolyspora spinosa]PKW18113.1 DDE superfamily endonuclease [Saccharopolyspora spinosa]PKW18661.1 DDE superfamily endonuclease [Saccharopolyspora spinosa]PKW18670.1 DDE superfamily endonuclease [Saccharopolyspora spinosa]
MNLVLPQINFIGVPRLMSVTYTATLPVRDLTVLYLSSLLHTQRLRCGTRKHRRSLSTYKQAILVLRWFLDGTRVKQLAVDHTISSSTAYTYLHEGFAVLAAQAPALESALLAAKIAGHGHISIDGTLIETDRVRTPGPTRGVDLWWSGKHSNHGGNIQVITAPDGWPLWTSQVRPGREHDTTALRAHPEIMPALTAWTSDDLPVLGDLGYEGESGTITVAFKKPKGGELTDDQKAHNKTHNGKRAIGERGNSVLKTTFKALRNISLCPRKIGTIVKAALVILHTEHDRTT